MSYDFFLFKLREEIDGPMDIDENVISVVGECSYICNKLNGYYKELKWHERDGYWLGKFDDTDTWYELSIDKEKPDLIKIRTSFRTTSGREVERISDMFGLIALDLQKNKIYGALKPNKIKNEYASEAGSDADMARRPF